MQKSKNITLTCQICGKTGLTQMFQAPKKGDIIICSNEFISHVLTPHVGNFLYKPEVVEEVIPELILN